MSFISVLACVMLAANADTTPSSSSVPDLSGRAATEATQIGMLAGFEVVSGDFFIAPGKWRSDIVPETIYLQSPRAGITVPAGTTLACWKFVRADADQPLVTMPDLRGKLRSEAFDLLCPLELPLLGNSSADDGDRIADQYPRPGQKVFAGTSVYLVTAPKDE